MSDLLASQQRYIAKLEKVAKAAGTVIGGRYIASCDMTLMLIIDGPERNAMIQALKDLEGEASS